MMPCSQATALLISACTTKGLLFAMSIYIIRVGEPGNEGKDGSMDA